MKWVLLLACFILVGCTSKVQGLVVTADMTAAAGESARPVLAELCVAPMKALADKARVLKEKSTVDEVEVRKLLQELKKISGPCDPAMKAQMAVLRFHAALRAGILAYQATGKLSEEVLELAKKAGEAAVDLTKALLALREEK